MQFNLFKSVFFILLFNYSIYSIFSQTVILPYQPQCTNPDPPVYEMEFPCVWQNELGRWDMMYSQFICYNVSQNFTASYDIQNADVNSYAYSSLLFTYNDVPMNVTNQVAYITAYFGNWIMRPPLAEITYPINTADQDNHSPGSHVYSNTFYTDRTYEGTVILFINREQYAPQFPCFYFNVSFSIV